MTRRASPYRLLPPRISEHATQRAVADLLRIELAREGHCSPHGVVWFAIDAAHYAGVPGTRVARGIVAGVPDLCILHSGAAYFIELKADNGVLSEAQREMCAALLWAQCHVGVARDADAVLRLLDAWRIPRNGRTRVAA